MNHLLRFHNQVDRFNAMCLQESVDEKVAEELSQDLLISWENIKEEHEYDIREYYGDKYNMFFTTLNAELHKKKNRMIE